MRRTSSSLQAVCGTLDRTGAGYCPVGSAAFRQMRAMAVP